MWCSTHQIRWSYLPRVLAGLLVQDYFYNLMSWMCRSSLVSNSVSESRHFVTSVIRKHISCLASWCLSTQIVWVLFVQVSASEILNIQDKVWYKPSGLNLNKCGKTLTNMLVTLFFPCRQTNRRTLCLAASWNGFMIVLVFISRTSASNRRSRRWRRRSRWAPRGEEENLQTIRINLLKTADFYCRNEAVTYWMFFIVLELHLS